MNQIVQHDMFGGPALRIEVEPRKLARHSDPITSHKAAAKVHEFSGGHKEIIVAALVAYGDMTVDEIATKARLKSQQINKRTTELAREGLIVETGEVRASASGCDERVWRAA